MKALASVVAAAAITSAALTPVPAADALGGKVVVLGSSVAHGYGSTPGMFFHGSYTNGYAGLMTSLLEQRGWAVTNISIDGQNTGNGVSRVSSDLLPLKPDCVIVGYSLANEGFVGSQNPAAITNRFVSNLTKIVSLCRSNGIHPVIGLVYANNRYSAAEYQDAKNVNLALNRWDVPSINFLGALEDGNGRWTSGDFFDALHPNNAGYREMFYSFVPSLFDAIRAGKTDRPHLAAAGHFARLTRDASTFSPITFAPSDVMHSFTVSFNVRSTNSGTIAAVRSGGHHGTIEIRDDKLVYVSPSGQEISANANNGDWHEVSLACRYAPRKTMFVVDGIVAGYLSEQYAPDQFVLGGPGDATGRAPAPPAADFQNWCVYRAAWNADEAAAQAQGHLQQASMEICAPLDDVSFASGVPAANVAQSLSVAMVTTGNIIASSERPASAQAKAIAPRIVNIYNFIRNSDFRLANSEDVLFDCTRRQIELLKSLNLPATWALQYDALINPRYQKLLKERLGTNDEIAAWWEIPQPLAEKAGLKWRGQHDWDPVANVGFSPGYTPEERCKLVDVYMADFKNVFGFYPRTVGSWFIDEVTLDYMAKRYGIVASCNCKDQIGTDFYTLWGGYWNQAYYPSRLNAYMPAQTRAGQIDVPIFRMLGSDPIYQHGTTPGLQSLEPVYPESGGSAKWVAWFMNNLIHQPSLAFGYAQAGQENSFGWDAMKAGLTRQAALFAAEADAGRIRVETLEQTGIWFRNHYPVTPATSVVALDDWKNENRKTVWYDSRFYRLNILWENGTLFIRDLHCFDQNVVSPTHDTALTATSLTYDTLPVVDWASWSKSATKPVGGWPVLLSSDGAMILKGSPVVRESGPSELSIEQLLDGGGKFSIVCGEINLAFAGVDGHGQALRWALNFIGGDGLKTIVKNVTADGIELHNAGANYRIQLASGEGSCRRLDNGDIQLLPNDSGRLVVILDAHDPPPVK